MMYNNIRPYLTYKENGKYGLIDCISRKKIIPAEYDFIDVNIYDDKVICVCKNGQYGYIDFNNKIVIPFEHKGASPFKEGLASVQISNGGYGYINLKNEFVISPQDVWESVSSFNNGIAFIRMNDNDHYFINKKGRYLHEKPFYSGGTFKDGYAIVSVGNYNHTGIINSNFEFVHEEMYDEIEYLGNYKFKVKKYLNTEFYLMKTGIYTINEGVVWDQKYDNENLHKIKIHELTTLFLSRLQQIRCFCQYPRIVDYILNGEAYVYDFILLRNIVMNEILDESGNIAPDKSNENILFHRIYTCKICGSKYKAEYGLNPRQDLDINSFLQIENTCSDRKGKKTTILRPISVISAGHLISDSRIKLLKEYNLYQTSNDNLIEYLFEEN